MKPLLPLLLATTALCGSFTVAWDPVSEPGVTYRLHMGPAPGVYTTNWTTTNIVYSVSNAPAGTNYLVVTAETNGVTSEPSNEIEVLVPSAPTGLRIVPVMETSSSPLGPWEQFVAFPSVEVFPTNNQSAFYRVRMTVE